MAAINEFVERLGAYRSEEELEELLSRMPERTNLSFDKGRSTPSNEGATEACSLILGLQQVAEEVDEGYRPGIQQFSLLRHGRLPDEDLKKALFLSRTATMFGRAAWDWNLEIWQTEDRMYTSGEYSLDHDLIRDLYRYREAIRSGALILLPSSFGSPRSYSTIEVGVNDRSFERVSLLERLEQTRVLKVDAPADLVDAFITRYRRNEQLVVLPELHVPWIEDIDVSAVLRLREEHTDEMARMQRAYHEAILKILESRRSLDFDQISREIAGDIVAPKLKELNKAYRRSFRHHRSLALAGGALAVLPIVGVIVTRSLMDSLAPQDVWNLVPSASAGMIAPLIVNIMGHKRETEAVDGEEYYILWHLQN